MPHELLIIACGDVSLHAEKDLIRIRGRPFYIVELHHKGRCHYHPAPKASLKILQKCPSPAHVEISVIICEECRAMHTAAEELIRGRGGTHNRLRVR